MKKLSFLFVCTLLIGLTACNEDYPDLEDGLYAEFNTSKGTFLAELYFEETPITIASFVSLAEGTSNQVVDSLQEKKFYDGLIFHRVIPDFMIQTGDPLGTGQGNPGYRFPDEIVDTLAHDSKGVLSMANAGPGTNGSQFFVTLAPTPWLDGRHTVFGKVIEGQDVVDSIGQVETGERDRPVQEVKIESIKIIRKGNAAKDFDAPKIFEEQMANLKAEEEELEARQKSRMVEDAQRFNALKENAEELESGLQIHYLEKGEGPKPGSEDMVELNYEGYFSDGRIFDTNREELATELGIFNQNRKDQQGYEPMVTPYGPTAPMIPGFKEGMQQLRVGDKAVVYIPSHLAYGPAGAGDVIPPDSDLIFVIELVGIVE